MFGVPHIHLIWCALPPASSLLLQSFALPRSELIHGTTLPPMHAQRIPVINFSSWPWSSADSENGVIRNPVLVFRDMSMRSANACLILLRHFSTFPLFCAMTTLVVPRIAMWTYC
ncbi:hypothetical protein EI94DRAFT_1712687 [Lactarius quietus]|nr:hypothetical protein EI94DRAFT_1712687 [Lactarius quietus]